MTAVDVRALVFDVFGTVVDWRGGVAREVRRLLGPSVDAAALADDWRERYVPSMEQVRSGELPWTPLDALHRASLSAVLADAGLASVPAEVRDELVLAWHRLDPWPDVLPGLRRLARSYVLAPLSNGNVALQVDLARRSGLPWDAVLGAEVVRHYKPDPEVYDSAAELLGVPPSSVVMVAAHLDDLAAARARGLRTAYVHRPDEFGGRVVPPSSDPDADLSVASFEELAEALGV
ncbi:haloacid dehalogenase type II [Geodermatophilus obscurus]|uniref:Haloacid dehalogenase, type II n=1 Tax=Geodermatophilus obscurus (strain ATCC 25078 / DSM 43160 / JCM 3152 / CCUG 61914 / KCC A-0152 / KCTC 9177 / NBRC 13315 / NRRL B-3577 / G-20) TaxID=526225 RepID=D2SG70_GEOOG|nr:haloacid dehalogenase type II [Geodermatophilus obscurus]ADB76938.1 haloacid dehalogenase, type II [Geodermatophilus obscurus DSM 43160]